MLDHGDEALGLNSLQFRSEHLAGQEWIFAMVFEVATVTRFPCEVRAAAERVEVVERPEVEQQQHGGQGGRRPERRQHLEERGTVGSEGALVERIACGPPRQRARR